MDAHGVPAGAAEAMAFSLLGRNALLGLPNHLPRCTGAAGAARARRDRAGGGCGRPSSRRCARWGEPTPSGLRASARARRRRPRSRRESPRARISAPRCVSTMRPQSNSRAALRRAPRGSSDTRSRGCTWVHSHRNRSAPSTSPGQRVEPAGVAGVGDAPVARTRPPGRGAASRGVEGREGARLDRPDLVRRAGGQLVEAHREAEAMRPRAGGRARAPPRARAARRRGARR